MVASLINNIFDPQLVYEQKLATDFLTKAILKGRLAHAYLFTGATGSDHMSLVKGLAVFLNCTAREPLNARADQISQNQLSCNLRLARPVDQSLSDYCQNCRWILTDKHPQALIVLNGEGSKSGRIAVEKTRQLTEELAKESQYVRVILIEDAGQEVFHRPAANAVLKTIESPRSQVVFVLFSRRAEDVLPTVVSRCQVLPLQIVQKHFLSLPAGNEQALAPQHGGGQNAASLSEDGASSAENWTDVLREKLAPVRKKALPLTFLELAKDLADLAADGVSAESLLDFVVQEEVLRFGPKAKDSPRMSGFLQAVVQLGEDAKLQIAEYVALKPALESFCLAWCKKKNEYGLW